MSESILAATAANIDYDDAQYNSTTNGPDDFYYQGCGTAGPTTLSLSASASAPVLPSARIHTVHDAYVPCLAAVPDGGDAIIMAAVSTTSAHALWAVDLDTARPTRKYDRAHSDMITAAKATVPNLFMTSSKDGSIRVWDIRAPEMSPVVTSKVLFGVRADPRSNARFTSLCYSNAAKIDWSLIIRRVSRRRWYSSRRWDRVDQRRSFHPLLVRRIAFPSRISFASQPSFLGTSGTRRTYCTSTSRHIQMI